MRAALRVALAGLLLHGAAWADDTVDAPVAPAPVVVPTEPAATAAPDLPAGVAADPTEPAVAPDPALARVEELERRLAELEGQLSTKEDPDRPQSRSGRGGLTIAVDELVRDAVGLGGPVDVAGTVEGNAVGLGGDVRVRDGGKVDGHAVSFGGEVVVEPGGTLTGEALELDVEDGATVALAVPRPDDWTGTLRDLARRFALLLGLAAAGTLAVTLWPRQVDEVARRITTRPFWYGIAGAALTTALTLGASVLAITVIGLPVSVLFLFVLALAWLVGVSAVCRVAGERLPGGASRSPLAAYLVGAGLLALISMVPVLGSAVTVLLALPAVGAAVVAGLSDEPEDRLA